MCMFVRTGGSYIVMHYIMYFKDFLIESANVYYMKLYIDVHNLSLYIWSYKKVFTLLKCLYRWYTKSFHTQ